MAGAADAEFPGLFCHRARLDWGVSVLSGESDGKRRYLFEGGEERTMAAAHEHLMQKVENPDRQQQATCARLMALIAKRTGRQAPTPANATTALLAQLEKLRLEYPNGFASDAWQSNERTSRARRAREGLAQQALSVTTLQNLAKSSRLEGVWSQVVQVVGESGLVSEALPAASNVEQQRALGESVRDVLYGSDHYERRFDRFVIRYETAFGTFPSWPAATALCAILFPVEHVCVDSTLFRAQLKAMSRVSTLSARPSGSAYVRCQSLARGLATALAAQGQVPLDLLDVEAFIRATAPRARRAAS